MQRIKRDDTVLVIAGRDRGKRGTVRRVFPRDERLIVQGVNMIKRHTRPRPPTQPGGIIEREAPLHISNVMLICAACDRPVRVGFRTRENGVKVRVCRSCGEDID